MQTNYLIIGQGIAGSVLALELFRRGKSVVIINKDGKSWSSNVAAGVYNPFNFRRMVPVPHADKACAVADEFYQWAEKVCKAEFHQKKNIIRVFTNEDERDLWTKYISQPESPFAEKKLLIELYNAKVKAPFGAGTVTGGGVVNTAAFMYHVKSFFESQNAYRDEWFDADKLVFTESGVCYDNRINADKIIFCEGHLALQNILYPEIPLAPTKGEILHVYIPELNATEVINGPVYVAPLGNDLYVCGATFNPGKSDEQTTEAGREELVKKLESLIAIPFRVESQFAGVRPAGRDRKPIIGIHPENNHIAVMNGTGSKGVLLSPMLAGILADHLENGTEIPREMNISRFRRK